MKIEQMNNNRVFLSGTVDGKPVFSHETFGEAFYEVVLLSVANAIWQMLVAKNGINKIVPFGMLTLVFGIIGGVLLFGDKITWHIVIGGICVTLGVFFTLKEYRIIKKARLNSVMVYRKARHKFVKRKLLK